MTSVHRAWLFCTAHNSKQLGCSVKPNTQGIIPQAYYQIFDGGFWAAAGGLDTKTNVRLEWFKLKAVDCFIIFTITFEYSIKVLITHSPCPALIPCCSCWKLKLKYLGFPESKYLAMLLIFLSTRLKVSLYCIRGTPSSLTILIFILVMISSPILFE